MSARFGRCVNQDFCSLAAQKAELRLDDGELFVCPECARPLAATKGWAGGGWARGRANALAALGRLLPPLGITTIGVGGIMFGLHHAEPAKPPAAQAAAAKVALAKVPAARVSSEKVPSGKLVMHAAKPRAVVAMQKPAPVRPLWTATHTPLAATKPPAPKPPAPDRVVLQVNAAPLLDSTLLPQLAAGFLTAGGDQPAAISEVGGQIRIAVTTPAQTLVILIRQAGFDAAALQSGAADLACTDKPPRDAERQLAGVLTEVVVGAMPAEPADAIWAEPAGANSAEPAGANSAEPAGAMPGEPLLPVICYARLDDRAADFAVFLGTGEAKAIVAASGFAAPPRPPRSPPPPPLPPLPPEPVAQAPAPPAANTAAAGPAAGKQEAAKQVAAKKAGPEQAAAKPADVKPDTGDTDAAADSPAGPRIVHVAPGSGMTLEGLQAMMSPRTGQTAADAGGDTPAKPRRIVLPAGARFSIGPYKPVNIPDQPSKTYFVRPEATQRPGSVKVDCKIDTTGLPTDCRELAHEGTAEAAAAILAWLPSGTIRYSPAMKNGHAVTERRVLTVNFGGPKPAEKLDDAATPAPAAKP